MAFTYLAGTDIRRVRLLIPDRVEAAAIFQDDEIEDFLELEGAIVKRAVALAVETIASDEALVQKVIKTQHLETDGAATAKALLLRAKELRSQAAAELAAVEAAADDGAGLFDVAEMVVDPFSRRERIWNQVQRGG